MNDVLIPKNPPFRCQAYIDWVRSLPSAISQREPCVAHHIINVCDGRTGGKASDLLTFPLTEKEHTTFHHLPSAWVRKHGTQWKHVALTLERALLEGVFR